MRIIFTACLISLFQIGFSQSITSIEPTQILGGIGDVLLIHGSDFGDVQDDIYVSFLMGDNNYMPPSSTSSLHYLSWTDTLISLEMPVAFSGKVKIVRDGAEFWSADDLKVTPEHVCSIRSGSREKHYCSGYKPCRRRRWDQ